MAISHTIPNNPNITSTSQSSVEDRAMRMLGNNLSPEIVAQATGVSVSRISQLLSDSTFAASVMELRCGILQKHNDRDNAYDEMEDTLIAKMRDLIPYMYKPGEVLHAIRIINNAHRRGSVVSHNEGVAATVVNITLPTIITQRFITDINNQVITAGTQDLVTVQSSQMNKMLSGRNGSLAIIDDIGINCGTEEKK